MDRIKQIETKEHKIVSQIPWSDTCFGCNGGSNEGIGLRLMVTEDGYVACVCHTKKCHQGFPGYIHGGIIASYFDEVLWGQTLIQKLSVSSMTVELNIRYLKAIKTEQEIRIVAKPARIEGRHIYVDGYILLSDNTVAAEGHAHYISVKEQSQLNENEEMRVKHIPEQQIDSIWF